MFAPPPPADTADVAQARADAADGVNFPVRATADRAPYLGVMRGTPGILAAMDYANLPQDCRIGIWDAIDDYDVDGTSTHSYPGDSNYPLNPQQYYTPDVDDIGMPPSYDVTQPTTNPPFSLLGDGPLNNPPISDKETYQQQIVGLTRAQAIACFGAKVAHAIYHESKNTFPWTLSTYSAEHLRGLFDPLFLFANGDLSSTWDLGSTPAAKFKWIIDYVPQEAYDVAVGFMGTPLSALDALANIQDNGVGFLRHNLNEDANWAIKVKDVFYPADPNDWIAKNGCHGARRIWAALARSINIPAIGRRGWFSPGLHSSIFFPTVDRGFWHADDVYFASSSQPLRGLAPTVKYSDFQTLVEPEGMGTFEARRQAQRLDAQIGLHTAHPQFVSNMLYTDSPAGLRGIKYLFSFYEWAFYGETATLDQVFAKIDAYCQELGGYPCIDNPNWVVYGRIEVFPGSSDTRYYISPWSSWSASGPLPADSSFEIQGEIHSVARVESGLTCEWLDTRPGYDPPADTIYDVVEDQTTSIGPPTYVLEDNTVTVYTQAPALTAQFAIVPDPTDGVGTYSAVGDPSGVHVIPNALPDDYTLTWLDTVPGYNPPAFPSTEGPTTLVTDGQISFGPPTYVAE